MLTRIKIWWMQFRFRQAALELLIAVCLACLVWLYTHSRARNSIEHVSIPVQVQLAAHQQEEYSLEVAEPRVLVSFSGPHVRIREVRRKLQRGLLKAVVTLTIPTERKNEVMFRELARVDEDSIIAPPGVKVDLAEACIPVTVRRLPPVPRQKLYDMADVPVHFLLPRDFPWKPRFDGEQACKVRLKVIGPVTETQPPVLAFVDLTSGNAARGRNLQPLRLQLPRDFQLAAPAPPLVEFYLDETFSRKAEGMRGQHDSE